MFLYDSSFVFVLGFLIMKMYLFVYKTIHEFS
jgi:hypothetical protein